MGGSRQAWGVFLHPGSQKSSIFQTLAQPFHYRQCPFPDSFGGPVLVSTAAIEMYEISFLILIKNQ